MILRTTGLILVALAACIGVVAFWNHTDFVAGSSAIGNILALVVFGIDRFSKKKDHSPLFSTQLDQLRIDDRSVDFEEGDIAFASDFQLTNHGDPVTDIEAIGGGRFSIQIKGPRSIPTEKSTMISIFPLPQGAEVPFQIKYRTKHGVEKVDFMFHTSPLSLKIRG